MDQLVQCPVCTLFLHNGITLESHLDTHPKDQVIKALCSLSARGGSNYGSRTSTPMHSERSYRSRSRTPAAEENSRWNHSHRSAQDSDRYWRRTPSRTPKTSSISRANTPVRLGEFNFENNAFNSVPSYSGQQFPPKSDKTQQTYNLETSSISELDPQYMYYHDIPEERELKYSKTSDYSSMESANVFAYNLPPVPAVKLQNTHTPAVQRKPPDYVKVLPKPNNILLKTNITGMQYIGSNVKPMQVVLPAAPTFVQKNVQNNMIMAGNVQGAQILDPKSITNVLPSNQFNQISSSFTPGTTVVTQNSQIIYREMVHNLDGKPFIQGMPAVLSGNENIANSQASSMYQNVMVVDQFGNTSCMYTTPQPIISKPCSTSVYNDTIHSVPPQIPKSSNSIINESNKTLIIEVGPIDPPTPVSTESPTSSAAKPSTSKHCPISESPEKPDKTDSKNDNPGTTKGLKILSNIKVEVPVQHHKNMLNTVMDLTGPNENDYPVRPMTPEKILPDLDDNNAGMDECTQPSMSSVDSQVSQTFSVIKNVGNPPSYKESTSRSYIDSKMDTEMSDSCPVPDLICNEKPSISPCSELSEHADQVDNNLESNTSVYTHNSLPQTVKYVKSTLKSPKSPKAKIPNKSNQTNSESNLASTSVQKSFKNTPLILNNLYVKKHKKILKIKNAKFPNSTATKVEIEPIASSSKCKSPENFAMNKLSPRHKFDSAEKNTLMTISIEKIKEAEDDDHHEFDADTEEQSMDIEPMPASNMEASHNFGSVDVVQVKVEINTSNEGGFSNEAGTSGSLTNLEGIRPINVISYGNMPGDFDDENSNHRELLELEASSKNKQFVNMMSDNYFGDNIYADYFTPDRDETFTSARDSSKDGICIWGEPSQKESEFVLPNFIHESYKIADSGGGDYIELESGEGAHNGDSNGCERDSKLNVLTESRCDGEPPLNICADERMPPRGELSGQESNGDMESSWSGIYNEVTPSEPYDLIARESWVSDGSEVDATEKRENLEENLQFPKSRLYTCSQCGTKFTSLKEMRAHKSLVHVIPTGSGIKHTYSRLVNSRAIKKEEKTDDLLGERMAVLGCPPDSKEAIAKTMLQVYDAMAEAKPKLEGLIKQEVKRRRKDFVCPTCKVDQLTDSAFHAHLKIHPLECLTCGKCFFRRANLALHIKTHLGIRDYKCEVCEKAFITRQKLTEHHNVHTGRAPVKCTVCDETFRRYSNMVQHRDRRHLQKKAKIRDYVCHCGAVFHSKAKLHWHKETHEDKPKACPYCSDKFVHAASLTRHMRRTHNEFYLSTRLKGKIDNVPCPVCKQVYLRSNLRAHLLTHSGKKPYLCVICNKAFTTKWNLKLHRWTHMSRSAKPFKCNLCKGAFIRQTEYISHMNAHKSVRPYTCNYCGCQFIRKYNCQRHVREHEMAKKYMCKVPDCGKSFHRSYYLSEHMKVHSGARPFSCNICGKTSSNKSNHNKHIKIHHAREPVATEA